MFVVSECLEISAMADGQDPEDDSDIPEDELRLNCLVFWSVNELDLALAFGVGRETIFRIEGITQLLSTKRDVRPSATPTGVPHSPVPFACL